jgi:hypothetical protein
MKEIKVKSAKFKGIYVSVWFDKNFCWHCKERPNTVNSNSSKYYIPLVFNKYLNKNDVLEYIKEKILNKYNIELADWNKAIHCKYLWQILDENGKIYEVWFEQNYDTNSGWWSIYKPTYIKKNDVLHLKEGLKIYDNLPFRFIGSLFTLEFIIMFSDDKYQYVVTDIQK